MSILHPTSPTPTRIYDTYWHFAAERQNVFFRRLEGLPPPWTDDPILQRFKFTNVYRASDRVSQFLIKEVIYQGDQSPQEIFFRTILSKLFNRIETWQLLEEKIGPLAWRYYQFNRYDEVLTEAILRGQRIYSAAYIMPPFPISEQSRKHRTHLKLLVQMMEHDVPQKVADAKSLFEVFSILRAYRGIGDFLAYQYAIDLNYSSMIDFSEMEFVAPGPGAKDGIRKCFKDLGGFSESDIIRFMADHQQNEFGRLGLEFRSLWGRPLQLIDCQNIFCEVSKYARLAHPLVKGTLNRTRIKQVYKPRQEVIEYWFPPKWGINSLIRKSGKRK